MKMERIRKIALSVFVLLAVAVLPLQAQASTKAKAFKAYRKWIKQGATYNYTKYDEFCLTRIDSDKIPELVARKKYDAYVSHFVVLTWKKNKLYKQTFASGVASVGGFRGEAVFIPKKGKIMQSSVSAGTGRCSDFVYKLTKKGIQTYAEGNFIIDLSSSYQWKGKSVSEKDYQKKLKKIMPTKKCKKLNSLAFRKKKAILKSLK